MEAVEIDTVGTDLVAGDVRGLVELWAPNACMAPVTLPYEGAQIAAAVNAMLGFDADTRARLASESTLLGQLLNAVVDQTREVDTFRAPW